jgi:hypothetical protein
MNNVQQSKQALIDLCDSIQAFLDHEVDEATYCAPVIDYHHPDDYRQNGIPGLRKFLTHAESEREYVIGVSDLEDNANPSSRSPMSSLKTLRLMRRKW